MLLKVSARGAKKTSSGKPPWTLTLNLTNPNSNPNPFQGVGGGYFPDTHRVRTYTAKLQIAATTKVCLRLKIQETGKWLKKTYM